MRSLKLYRGRRTASDSEIGGLSLPKIFTKATDWLLLLLRVAGLRDYSGQMNGDTNGENDVYILRIFSFKQNKSILKSKCEQIIGYSSFSTLTPCTRMRYRQVNSSLP